MKSSIYKVEGMSCSHCVNAIRTALGDFDGVKTVDVNLKEKKVTVEHDDAKVSTDTIKSEIEDLGYEATLMN